MKTRYKLNLIITKIRILNYYKKFIAKNNHDTLGLFKTDK